MPYNYKGFELPVHYDKNWHSYVDPFFRALIDKDENYNNSIQNIYALLNNSQHIYTIEQYDEVGDIIYTLRTYDTLYVVYKVVNLNDNFVTYIATIELNSSYLNKNDMWASRNNLVYSIV